MGVEFEENNIARNYAATSERVPKLAAWLMKKGLAKSVNGANRIQIIAALVFFALAIFFAVR